MAKVKKRYARINVANLIQAITREGGINIASSRWGVSPYNLNRLLSGELPRFDFVKRVLKHIPADQLFLGQSNRPQRKLEDVSGTTGSKIHMLKRQLDELKSKQIEELKRRLNQHDEN